MNAVETISQDEAAPDAPAAVEGVTGAALATAWSRIEHHICWRFSPRLVTWRVGSDGGEWVPPLKPVVNLSALKWDGETWQAVTLATGLDGWMVPPGQYRIAATVGAGPVPAAVATAVKRLADYVASKSKLAPGLTSVSVSLGGELTQRFEGEPGAMARALQESGAADLLRAWRRV